MNLDTKDWLTVRVLSLVLQKKSILHRLGEKEKAWCVVIAHLLLHQGVWFWNIKNLWKKNRFQHPEASKMEGFVKIVKTAFKVPYQLFSHSQQNMSIFEIMKRTVWYNFSGLKFNWESDNSIRNTEKSIF